MNFAQRTHRKSWAASLALVLVWAVLWAQLLGLTHRVVHGPQLAGSVVAAQTGAMSGVVSGGEAGLFAALFAGHQSADCSTFDQLSHADALAGVQTQALPALTPLPPLAVATVIFLLQRHLRLQARGPPVSL